MMLILYQNKIYWGHKILDTPNRGTALSDEAVDAIFNLDNWHGDDT